MLDLTLTPWIWALSVSGAIYGISIWLGSHLSHDSKFSLALWMSGAGKDQWPVQFAAFFDTVFGVKHLTLRCFIVSSLISISFTCIIYAVFFRSEGPLTGRAEFKAFEGGSLIFVSLFAVIFNIIPDYLSLLQTRFFLRITRHVRGWIGVLIFLFTDIVFTSAIWLALFYAFLFILSGLNTGLVTFTSVFINPWQIIQLQSILSVFFISTFSTSIWIWVFIISRLQIRVFSRTRVFEFLDTERQPVKILAFFSASAAFLMIFVSSLVFQKSSDGTTWLEKLTCEIDYRACVGLARVTTSEPVRVDAIGEFCKRSDTEECLFAITFMYIPMIESGTTGFESESEDLLKKVCAEHPSENACLGILSESTVGDFEFIDGATAKLRIGCDDGVWSDCHLLGRLYDERPDSKRELATALRYFAIACEHGHVASCLEAGNALSRVPAEQRDPERQEGFYEVGCTGRDVRACHKLGLLRLSSDTGLDFAIQQFRRGCDAGFGPSCFELANTYLDGESGDDDGTLARRLFLDACDAGSSEGCFSAAHLLRYGIYGETYLGTAAGLYTRACAAGVHEACHDFGSMLLAVEGYFEVERHEGLRKACEERVYRACFELGDLYANGHGVAQSDAEAFYFWRTSCNGGYADGCSSAGVYLELGLGVAADADLATSFYKNACQASSTLGCYNLALKMLGGPDRERHFDTAVELLRDACKEDLLESCYKLGYVYHDSEEPLQDFVKTRLLFRQACEGGLLDACSDLGFLLEKGVGGATDERAARSLYLSSCEGGIAQGCFNLSVLGYSPDLAGLDLENTTAVERDDFRAAGFYQLNCDEHFQHPESCLKLGFAFAEGRGVDADDIEARKAFELACSSGSSAGCANAGTFHQEGRGGDEDFAAAVSFHKQACSGESLQAKSCLDLGLALAEGRGVDQDDNEARKAFELACSSGSSAGCANAGVFHQDGRGGDVDLEAAILFYKRACDGDIVNGCQGLGQVLAQMLHSGLEIEPRQIFGAFERSCMLNSPDGCFEVGLMYANGQGVLQDFDRALYYYARTLESLGEIEATPAPPPYFYYVRGIALEQTGKWIEAKADLEKSISLQPNQPDFLNYYGYAILERGGNLGRAEQLISHALRLAPESGFILDSYGWLKYKKGEFETAVSYLEQALEAGGQSAIPLDHLGDAYLATGRVEDALRTWRNALVSRPISAEMIKSIETKIDLYSLD